MDQDNLEYTWSCSVGSFPIGVTDRSLQWQAPSTVGSYSIAVTVSDGVDIAQDSISVSVTENTPDNTAPSASLMVTPSNGTIITNFQVDASGSSDSETPVAQLEVRWDWENDGSYDTDWSTTKTSSHLYSGLGEFTIKLQVRDPEGYSDETAHSVTVTGISPGEMISIPSGIFSMGQSGVATPEHDVTLTHDFLLGKYEVTNQEFLIAVQWAFDQGLITANASTVQAYGQELLDLDAPDCEIFFAGGIFGLREATSNSALNAYPEGYNPTDHPVKEVSWYGSASYCDWLSLQNGLAVFYDGNWHQAVFHDPYLATGYRLPTEAEWEYAARFNDGRTYPWGEASPTINYANFNDNVGWSSPIGSYPIGASELELMDMAGNLWEWVGDRYGSYSSSPQNDPYGSPSGSNRAVRGGYWNNHANRMCCASRYSYSPYSTHGYIGFRLCLTISF